MVDEIVRGQVSTPMENLDQFITGEITNHLFENVKIPHSGQDLPALNIQRGTYNINNAKLFYTCINFFIEILRT